MLILRFLVLVLLVGLISSLVHSADSPHHEQQQSPETMKKMNNPTAQNAAFPGALYTGELRQQLEKARLSKGSAYRPRTEHLNPDGSPKFTNRLILQDSPYLLQHAHNPVDWYPWSPEAFARAQRENKPIFLSIGYSTCHWCHVMERESFENMEIARFLNQHFVSIKVDRERRPDVDQNYMTAIQLMTQHGGWPASSFLVADGKPFFGGTYFPPEQFLALLQRISAVWKQQHDDLVAQAQRVANAVIRISNVRGEAAKIDAQVVEHGIAQILAKQDELQGGFSDAPKFPQEALLLLLLDAVERDANLVALKAVNNTLTHMANGGIYDQVGGGFHRYSTDNAWLAPHFEKMLYNQAHLARVYARAYRLTGHSRYERVARQTLDYVLREMLAPDGGFYSATDADSEGSEGRYFLWTIQQVYDALEKEAAAFTVDLFAMTKAGNFEGSNILYLPGGLEGYAHEHNLSTTDLEQRLDPIRERLRKRRAQREAPLRDDKIITSWNAAMIATLGEASEILNEPRYLEAAKRTAEYLWQHQRQPSGALWRVSLNGKASVGAVLKDYAYLADALMTLYDVTHEQEWLTRARSITALMLELFWDRSDKGFFDALEKTEVPLMTRAKQGDDGAMPSGNAMALRTLARLAIRTGEERYHERATETLAAFSSLIKQIPSGYATMLAVARDLQTGETGSRRYAARGKVHSHALLDVQGQLVLNLSVQPGWHINAHQPLDKDLIPTEISLATENRPDWTLSDVHYPTPERVRLGFSPAELAVYQGQFQIKAKLNRQPAVKNDSIKIVSVELKLQACSDRICLPPESQILQVSSLQR